MTPSIHFLSSRFKYAAIYIHPHSWALTDLGVPYLPTNDVLAKHDKSQKSVLLGFLLRESIILTKVPTIELIKEL